MADYLESQAAKVVSELTEWRLDPCDPGGGSEQRPDFSLHVDGEKVGYLEVTARLDRNRESFPAARSKHGFRITSSKLYWWVTVDVQASVKSLKRPIAEAISAIEAEERQAWFVHVQHPVDHPYFPNGLTAETNEKLHRAGVVFVWAMDPASPEEAGRVHIEQEGVGNFGSDIVGELNQELEKRDNIAKMKYALNGGGLGKAPLSEMFVWFDGTPGAVQLRGALSTPDHPSAKPRGAPSVPPGVTGVWVATIPVAVPPFAMVVWHHTPAEGWQLVSAGYSEEEASDNRTLG